MDELSILQIIGLWIACGLIGFPGMFNILRLIMKSAKVPMYGRDVVGALMLSLLFGPAGIVVTTGWNLVEYLCIGPLRWVGEKPGIKRLLDKQIIGSKR